MTLNLSFIINIKKEFNYELEFWGSMAPLFQLLWWVFLLHRSIWIYTKLMFPVCLLQETSSSCNDSYRFGTLQEMYHSRYCQSIGSLSHGYVPIGNIPLGSVPLGIVCAPNCNYNTHFWRFCFLNKNNHFRCGIFHFFTTPFWEHFKNLAQGEDTFTIYKVFFRTLSKFINNLFCTSTLVFPIAIQQLLGKFFCKVFLVNRQFFRCIRELQSVQKSG